MGILVHHVSTGKGSLSRDHKYPELSITWNYGVVIGEVEDLAR